jgi:hypothetical protein
MPLYEFSCAKCGSPKVKKKMPTFVATLADFNYPMAS